MTIRQATLEDIPLINRMAWQVFPQTYRTIITEEQIRFMMDWMYSPESLRRQMTEEQHTYLIASEGDEPVGYVSVQPQRQGLWHLQKIYVLPQWQKHHVGGFLFREALNFVRSHSSLPCTVELNVNRYNPALGFYEHEGMRKVRTEDNDIGHGFQMNDYVMAITLG